MADDLRRDGLENEAEGTKTELKGKVEKHVGGALGDESQHVKGIAKELGGKIQKNLGRAEQDADER